MNDDLQQKIAAALEQKIPMADIAAHLASHENPEYSAYGKSFLESQAAPATRRSDYQEEKKNLVGTITPMLDLINENPKEALAAVAAAIGIPYAIKTKNAIEDRRMKKELHQSEIKKNEAYAQQVKLQEQKLVPSTELSHADVANMVKTERNVTGKPNPLAASFEEKFKMPLAEAEQLSGGKITNAVDAEIVGNALTKGQGVSVNPMLGSVGNAPSGVPGANPMDQLTKQPPAPQLIQPKPPVGAVAPQPMAAAPAAPTSVADAVAGGVNPTQAVTQTIAQEIDAAPTELRTGTGKIAYAGQGPAPTISKRTGQPQFKKEYALEDIPKGFALVPGGQYIDPLRQDLGQIEYKKAFTGRDFPQTYEEAIAAGKDINRSLGRATREEAKAAGLPYGEITPGITQKTTENKKLVKIIGKAGLAGALVSLADLALAKTPEEKANAGLGLLGAILPPGMDINAAGAGSTLSPQQIQANQTGFENQFKLGSPFAQTEAAKTYRLREKAGAGRGVAPPSAYQR